MVVVGIAAAGLMIMGIVVVAGLLSGDRSAGQPSALFGAVPVSSAPVPSETFRPVDIPDWIEQDYIRVNPYSRPGTIMDAVNGVVVHSTGNPGVSALNHWKYFDRLADQTDPGTAESKSCNFVIGLEGEILMLMPMYEIAYASNHRNGDTLSIECCQTDNAGTLTQATYDSLVRLVRWLCEEFGLGRDQILRHADVYEWKDCPRYFHNNPDQWEIFRDDVLNN